MLRLLERFKDWLAHTEPERREVVVANVLLVGLLGTGTVGYMLIEGWPWMDGLYMTFITLTTIGFSEVRALSAEGRIFTIVIGILGIGTVAFIATRTAQILLTNQRLSERRMAKKIRELRDHFILCGYGRIGRRIAEDLLQAQVSFVVVDRAPLERETPVNSPVLFVMGDAEEEATLREAGIDRARGLILTLPEDSANVFVTLMARERNPDVFILARANQLKNQRKLIHAGADKVLSPDEIGADRMAQVILRPHVDRFMEQVLRTGPLGLQMEEVEVSPGAPLAGKTLADSNFRQEFDAIVVAVIDQRTKEMKFNPSVQAQILAGDILIVMGSKEMIERLREAGCNPVDAASVPGR